MHVLDDPPHHLVFLAVAHHEAQGDGGDDAAPALLELGRYLVGGADDGELAQHVVADQVGHLLPLPLQR